MSSKFIDFMQSGGKIKQSELEKFFSKYGDAGALESALTTSPDMNIAARNFNNNWRQPGMAEAPIPGAEPTDLSATQKKVLDPVPWLVNMAGEGPRYQQNPASLQTWMKKQAEEEVKQAREQKAIMVLVAKNPKYFVNRPPESFVSMKDAEAYQKHQQDLENKLLQIDKNIKGRKDLKGGGDAWKADVSTGTVAGGGVAPVITPQDKAAFDWAKQNPNDPRATGIMLKLKQKGL